MDLTEREKELLEAATIALSWLIANAPNWSAVNEIELLRRSLNNYKDSVYKYKQSEFYKNVDGSGKAV